MNVYQWMKCLSVKEIAHACIEMFYHYQAGIVLLIIQSMARHTDFYTFLESLSEAMDLLRALLFFDDVNTD